jgi:hypothetical protein
MKKNIIYTLIAFLVVACSEESVENTMAGSGVIPINIENSYPVQSATRATDNGFVADDAVGIFVVDYNSDGTPGVPMLKGNRASNTKFIYDGGRWDASYQLYWANSKTPADFYGYYPFDQSLSSVTEYFFAVEQKQDTATNGQAGYEKSDLLWSKVEKVMPTLSTVPMKYKQYLDNLQYNVSGDFKVLTPQDIAGPATVAALRTFIEKHKLDILFVDQFSLLEDTSRAKTTHEKVANISKEIKNLQVLTGIPIISVSQMNRTKEEDGEQDTTQIGLSDRIGQDATCVLMLSRKMTYEDDAKTKIKDDQLILNVVKSRDGGCGKLIYKADFNNGTFIYLNPNLGEQDSQELENRYSSEYSDSGDYNPYDGSSDTPF